MKHVKIFEEFIFEKELVSTEMTVSGDPLHKPSNWDAVARWVWAALKAGRHWKVSFVLPKVAEFEMEMWRPIKINPLADLREKDFKVGRGTNFDTSVMWEWYGKRKNIPYAFSILVRNCSRAAFADRVKTDLVVDYDSNLGFIPGEHIFDPGNRTDDLYNWVEYAPSVLTARGTFTEDKPELVKALAELEKFLPNKLTVKLEIQ